MPKPQNPPSIKCKYCKQVFPITWADLSTEQITIVRGLDDADDAPPPGLAGQPTVRRRVKCTNCDKDNIVPLPKEWFNE